MIWSSLSLLLLGTLLGFFASVIANHFTQPLGHWFFSLKGIRSFCYEFPIFNNGNKIIHKCSLIQRCNLEEFSAMSCDFVERKFSSANCKKKYVIFNTLEPFEFYDDIKYELRLFSKLFSDYEEKVNAKDFVNAKASLKAITDQYENFELSKYKHLKKLNNFNYKFRIHFNEFDLSDNSKITDYTNRNKLFHFIFFNDFVNRDVECSWVFDKTDDGIVGIDGIIINDRYLLDYNSKTSSLFYAKSNFDSFDQKGVSKEPFYNKYLSLLNLPTKDIGFVPIDFVGGSFYGEDFTTYLSA